MMSLEDTLWDSFQDWKSENFNNESQLEYARQLINRGKPDTKEIIRPLLPSPSQDELRSVAERVHKALISPNPEPETVYAALTPFERNTELLYKLNASYEAVAGKALQP